MTKAIWLGSAGPAGAPDADVHVAFRGTFALESAATVEVRLIDSGWFLASVDGVEVFEGPLRFPLAHPEWTVASLSLEAGRHVLAVHAHHHGVETQQLPPSEPFLAAQVLAGGEPVALDWRAYRLDAYEQVVGRLNSNLGWIEWCDTSRVPDGWVASDFDDSEWEAPVPVDAAIGEPAEPTISPVRNHPRSFDLVASGTFAERFGVARDNPAVTFALRDLHPSTLPPTGSWFRFDTGRVRLGRARIELDLPVGTAVEIGYSESLIDGRVMPFTAWSNGASCLVDHYQARGGPQVFGPMAPRGTRFIEVHVGAPVASVEVLGAGLVERGAFGRPIGSFTCGDERLERVWSVSFDTLRACAEDAIVDCPTRERGQWVGDATVVGQEIIAAGYSDLRHIRRALVQAAQCPNEEGFVVGNAPGTRFYLSTYSAQWFASCLRLVEHTGDLGLLSELLPAARANARAFLGHLGGDGRFDDAMPWAFVDWGFGDIAGSENLPLHLHALNGARALLRWASLMGADVPEAAELYEAMNSTVGSWLAGAAGDEKLGYHSTVLAVLAGLIPAADLSGAIDRIKQRMATSFPNRADATRVESPLMSADDVITPYFAHFSHDALWRHGAGDFALDQVRSCWGWFLDEGFTTWPEVFDSRWSHCHHWSGAPAWQLSRHVLGLQPRQDLAPGRFEVLVRTGGLARAAGVLPVAGADGKVEVEWVRDGEALDYRLVSDVPVSLDVGGGRVVAVSPGEQWSATLVDGATFTGDAFAPVHT